MLFMLFNLKEEVLDAMNKRGTTKEEYPFFLHPHSKDAHELHMVG